MPRLAQRKGATTAEITWQSLLQIRASTSAGQDAPKEMIRAALGHPIRVTGRLKMNSQSAAHNNGQATEVLARQGLRLPPIVLRRLRDAGIYCQPTVSVEHQNLAKKYVIRGVESGGAVAALGTYSSFVGEHGEPFALASARGQHRSERRACDRGIARTDPTTKCCG